MLEPSDLKVPGYIPPNTFSYPSSESARRKTAGFIFCPCSATSVFLAQTGFKSLFFIISSSLSRHHKTGFSKKYGVSPAIRSVFCFCSLPSGNAIYFICPDSIVKVHRSFGGVGEHCFKGFRYFFKGFFKSFQIRLSHGRCQEVGDFFVVWLLFGRDAYSYPPEIFGFKRAHHGFNSFVLARA